MWNKVTKEIKIKASLEDKWTDFLGLANSPEAAEDLVYLCSMGLLCMSSVFKKSFGGKRRKIVRIMTDVKLM